MNWNDDRLDRLADEVGAVRVQVDALGRHIDERFEKQEARMTERFENQEARMSARFEKQEARMTDRFENQEARMTDRFENQDARINDRFDRLQTSLVVTLAGFLAAFASVVIPTVF